MCTGCMEMKPKKELIRIVRSKEGEITIDLVGKKPGRGAYICKNEECLTKAFKTKRLEKNLEAKISDELYNKLKEEINIAE
nr:YlxR family protein [Clostridium swellfunianum]